ncbi:hypothetical protein [Yersinia pekkanenii]|uniref:Uncharacterized protein n=1 Tax=Yersinia pekkanenii TaxID=1288385 RepID=A0A0T9RPM3_9GAMM|nr:hypothetical protein [Yersinia pekkanenii]CNI75380.1 Uncharacterised protein [Yersinia pekkanenii]CRY69745.1 Uncharacterised protein [Yersinia pekkanenii]
MTTIAWDGRTLATDGQSTLNGLVCSLTEQKIYTPAEHEKWKVNGDEVLAIAISGDCGAEYELRDKLAKGVTYETEFSSDSRFSAIAIRGPFQAYGISSQENSTQISFYPLTEHCAVGTGATVASTAMKLGKTAIEAIDVAIEMDVYSGGNVQAYTVPFRL